MSAPAQTIATIHKNAAEEVRVTLDSFKGTNLIDVRVWVESAVGPAGAVRCPTKKGVSLNVRSLPELIGALNAAHDTAREMGWVGDE